MPLGRDLSGPAGTAAPKDVPNRTMIMLASAAAHTLLSEAAALIGRWSAADALSEPDCREPFLAAAEQTLRLATGREFRILRPLIDDVRPAVVRRALAVQARSATDTPDFAGAAVHGPPGGRFLYLGWRGAGAPDWIRRWKPPLGEISWEQIAAA
jgi:hypothetical protein